MDAIRFLNFKSIKNKVIRFFSLKNVIAVIVILLLLFPFDSIDKNDNSQAVNFEWLSNEIIVNITCLVGFFTFAIFSLWASKIANISLNPSDKHYMQILPLKENKITRYLMVKTFSKVFMISVIILSVIALELPAIGISVSDTLKVVFCSLLNIVFAILYSICIFLNKKKKKTFGTVLVILPIISCLCALFDLVYSILTQEITRKIFYVPICGWIWGSAYSNTQLLFILLTIVSILIIVVLAIRLKYTVKDFICVSQLETKVKTNKSKEMTGGFLGKQLVEQKRRSKLIFFDIGSCVVFVVFPLFCLGFLQTITDNGLLLNPNKLVIVFSWIVSLIMGLIMSEDVLENELSNIYSKLIPCSVTKKTFSILAFPLLKQSFWCAITILLVVVLGRLSFIEYVFLLMNGISILLLSAIIDIFFRRFYYEGQYENKALATMIKITLKLLVSSFGLVFVILSCFDIFPISVASSINFAVNFVLSFVFLNASKKVLL